MIGEKESSCGCAGCYSAPHAIPLYLEVFESENKLQEFENFASVYGPNFYGMPVNSDRIKIKRISWTPDKLIEISKHKKVYPLAFGKKLNWKVEN